MACRWMLILSNDCYSVVRAIPGPGPIKAWQYVLHENLAPSWRDAGDQCYVVCTTGTDNELSRTSIRVPAPRAWLHPEGCRNDTRGYFDVARERVCISQPRASIGTDRSKLCSRSAGAIVDEAEDVSIRAYRSADADDIADGLRAGPLRASSHAQCSPGDEKAAALRANGRRSVWGRGASRAFRCPDHPGEQVQPLGA